MKSSHVFLQAALAFLLPLAGWAVDEVFQDPDSLVLKDGRTVRGLIVKNSATEVILQERHAEIAYPKSGIVRILDVPDQGTEFTRILKKGELPSWRVIVNDLRSHDHIKSLVEIPAVKVDVGVFRNVPYKSFRINDYLEFNIYGDPERPAGLELGIFGRRAGDQSLQTMLRAYLAGFLTTRAEIDALYSVGLKEGTAKAGNFVAEVTPTTAEDAFGAWWISLFHAKAMEAVRLSDAAYDALTLPADKVVDRSGRAKSQEWTKADLGLASRMDSDSDEVIQRGFYRDKNGVFRIYGDGRANP
ncbi:MAG: hypothetical protein WEB60_04840 [Terrimicrobiaceae bacterium]